MVDRSTYLYFHLKIKEEPLKPAKETEKPAGKYIVKSMKYVQDYQWVHQNDVNDIVLVSLFLTLNIFYTFF